MIRLLIKILFCVFDFSRDFCRLICRSAACRILFCLIMGIALALKAERIDVFHRRAARTVTGLPIHCIPHNFVPALLINALILHKVSGLIDRSKIICNPDTIQVAQKFT